MKEKDKAYHKSNKMKYLALRERLLKAVARNKKAYFKSACSMNPKKAWHSINSLIRENKRNDKQLSHADLENISNIFKKVFEPEDLFYVDDDNEKKRIGEYSITVEEWEIVEEIMRTRSNACGPDNVSGFIYKNTHFNWQDHCKLS